jgi:AcrR family transcriptional regulator
MSATLPETQSHYTDTVSQSRLFVMTSDLRDRSREILRAELASAAADFCAAQGFADVTVDDIAQSIGISRATFFRYFRSKEDAVVAAAHAGRPSLAAAVRDAAAGDTAWRAIRNAKEPTVETARTDTARLRARVQMIGSAPGLRARLALDRADDRAALAEALADRVDERDTAVAVAAAAIAAVDAAWTLWSADADADFGDALDRAFRLVAAAPEARLGP